MRAFWFFVCSFSLKYFGKFQKNGPMDGKKLEKLGNIWDVIFQFNLVRFCVRKDIFRIQKNSNSYHLHVYPPDPPRIPYIRHHFALTRIVVDYLIVTFTNLNYFWYIYTLHIPKHFPKIIIMEESFPWGVLSCIMIHKQTNRIS